MDFAELKDYLDKLESMYGIAQSECAVIKNGEKIFAYNSQGANSKKDVYYIFSMTKLVTSVAVMQCIEKKLLSAEDFVSKYLPEFGDITVKTDKGIIKAIRKMTVKDLLSMQGGYNYDIDAEQIKAAKNNSCSTREMVRAMSKIPLEFEPSTNFEYSLCYDVLAAVVEEASKMRFGEYLEQYIFKPLSMNDTTFKLTDTLRDRMNEQYRYNADIKEVQKFDLPQNRFVLTPQYESGGAGLISTFEDYCKFASALSLGGIAKNGYKLLTRKSIDEIRTNRMNAQMLSQYQRYNDWGYGYGYGVRTLIDCSKCTELISAGVFEITGAAGCYALFDVGNEMAVVYFQHVLGIPEVPEIVHHRIRDLVYKQINYK